MNSTFAEARENGGLIEITDNKADLKGADVIYGDVWASHGREAQIPERVRLLSPFPGDGGDIEGHGKSRCAVPALPALVPRF